MNDDERKNGRDEQLASLEWYGYAAMIHSLANVRLDSLTYGQSFDRAREMLSELRKICEAAREAAHREWSGPNVTQAMLEAAKDRAAADGDNARYGFFVCALSFEVSHDIQDILPRN